MPELIKRGHVYSAVGPLFKITYNNKTVYAMTNKERDTILSNVRNKYKYMVTRFKGLGELNAHDLRETMIAPETRTLVQYNIEDFALVAEMFSKLLGTDSDHRKEFLEGEV